MDGSLAGHSTRLHRAGELEVCGTKTPAWTLSFSFPLRHQGFPSGSDGKEYACSAGDLCSIPGSGRSPGEGNDDPLQYLCLENSMDGETWRATVHGVTKSRFTMEQLTLSLRHPENLVLGHCTKDSPPRGRENLFSLLK